MNKYLYTNGMMIKSDTGDYYLVSEVEVLAEKNSRQAKEIIALKVERQDIILQYQMAIDQQEEAIRRLEKEIARQAVAILKYREALDDISGASTMDHKKALQGNQIRTMRMVAQDALKQEKE